MSKTLRLNIPVLLPHAPDSQDGCVGRLIALVRAEPGILEAHLVEGSTELKRLQLEAVPQARFHADLSTVPMDGPVLLGHTLDDQAETVLIAIGRDIEAQVLARAVRWIAERRVLANGARTVVFR